MNWYDYLVDEGWDMIRMSGLGGAWELADVEGEVSGGGARAYPSTGFDKGSGTLHLTYQFLFDDGEYEDARSLAGELADDLERMKLGFPYSVRRVDVDDASNSTAPNGNSWAYCGLDVKIEAHYD
jgi:hypothetical protein